MWDIRSLRSHKSNLAGRHEDGEKMQIITNSDNAADNTLKYKASIFEGWCNFKYCYSFRCPNVKFLLHRSSRSQIFFKIGVLKNCAIFTRKHLCLEPSASAQQLYKNETSTQVTSAKLLRTPFFREHFRRLLLASVLPYLGIISNKEV